MEETLWSPTETRTPPCRTSWLCPFLHSKYQKWWVYRDMETLWSPAETHTPPCRTSLLCLVLHSKYQKWWVYMNRMKVSRFTSDVMKRTISSPWISRLWVFNVRSYQAGNISARSRYLHGIMFISYRYIYTLSSAHPPFSFSPTVQVDFSLTVWETRFMSSVTKLHYTKPNLK